MKKTYAIFIARDHDEFTCYQGDEILSGGSVPFRPQKGKLRRRNRKAVGSGVKQKFICQENLSLIVLDRDSCVDALREKQKRSTDDEVSAFYQYICDKTGANFADDVYVFCHWGKGGSRIGVNGLDNRLTSRLKTFTEAKNKFSNWKINAISSQRSDLFSVEGNNGTVKFGIDNLPSTIKDVNQLAQILQAERQRFYACTQKEILDALKKEIKHLNGKLFKSKRFLIIPATEDVVDIAENVNSALVKLGAITIKDSDSETNDSKKYAQDCKSDFYPLFIDFAYTTGGEVFRAIDDTGLMVPEEFVLRFVKDGGKSDKDQTIKLIKGLQSRIKAWGTDPRLKAGFSFADLRDWIAGRFRQLCLLDQEVHGTNDDNTINLAKIKSISATGGDDHYLEGYSAQLDQSLTFLQANLIYRNVYRQEIEALKKCLQVLKKGREQEAAKIFLNEVVYTPHGSQAKYFSAVGKLSCLLIDDEAAAARKKILAIKLDERLSKGKCLNDIIDIKEVVVDARCDDSVIQQAKIAFTKIQSKYATYDFVLLDLRLADKAGADPSGYQLIKVIRQFFPQVPIVIYSRYDDMGHISRAFRMGADWFMRKDEIKKLPRHLLSILSIRNWRKEWDAIKRLELCKAPEVICDNVKKKDDFEKVYKEERKYLTYKCLEKLPGRNIEVTPTGGGFSSSATFRARKWSEYKHDKKDVDKKDARIYLQDPVIIKIDTAFNTMTEYERYFRFIRPYIANESGRVESKEITLDHNNSAITYTFAGKNDKSRALDTMKNMMAEDVRYMARCDYKKYESVFDEIFDDILPKIHRVTPELESEVSSYPNRIFGEKDADGTGFIDNYLARIPLSRQFEVKQFVDPGTSEGVPFEMHGVATKEEKEGKRKIIEAYALTPKYSKLNVILRGDVVDHVARYRELKQGQTLRVKGDWAEETKTTEQLDDIILQSIHVILDPKNIREPKCFDGKKDYKFENKNRNQEARNCFMSMCYNFGIDDDAIEFDRNDKYQGIVGELFTRIDKFVSDDKKGERFRCNVGIVHGDLNYANIMVDSKKDGTIEDVKDVWLIDFARTRRDIVAHDFNVIFTATFSQLFNNDLWNDKGVGGDERYAARITRIFKTFINDAMFAREDEVPDYIAGDRRFTLFYKIFRRIRKAALDNMTEDMYTLTTALCCLYTFKVFLKYEKNIQGAAALLATAYICIKHLNEAVKS